MLASAARCTARCLLLASSLHFIKYKGMQIATAFAPL